MSIAFCEAMTVLTHLTLFPSIADKLWSTWAVINSHDSVSTLSDSIIKTKSRRSSHEAPTAEPPLLWNQGSAPQKSCPELFPADRGSLDPPPHLYLYLLIDF